MVLVEVSLLNLILVTFYIDPDQKKIIVLHGLVSCDLGSCVMELIRLAQKKK